MITETPQFTPESANSPVVIPEYIPEVWPSVYRVLRALYFKSYLIHELNEVSEVQNSPDVISASLRPIGIEIYSEYVPNPNPKSNRQIVRYHLMPSSKPFALEILHQHQRLNKEIK